MVGSVSLSFPSPRYGDVPLSNGVSPPSPAPADIASTSANATALPAETQDAGDTDHDAVKADLQKHDAFLRISNLSAGKPEDVKNGFKQLQHTLNEFSEIYKEIQATEAQKQEIEGIVKEFCKKLRPQSNPGGGFSSMQSWICTEGLRQLTLALLLIKKLRGKLPIGPSPQRDEFDANVRVCIKNLFGGLKLCLMGSRLNIEKYTQEIFFSLLPLSMSSAFDETFEMAMVQTVSDYLKNKFEYSTSEEVHVYRHVLEAAKKQLGLPFKDVSYDFYADRVKNFLQKEATTNRAENEGNKTHLDELCQLVSVQCSGIKIAYAVAERIVQDFQEKIPDYTILSVEDQPEINRGIDVFCKSHGDIPRELLVCNAVIRSCEDDQYTHFANPDLGGLAAWVLEKAIQEKYLKEKSIQNNVADQLRASGSESAHKVQPIRPLPSCHKRHLLIPLKQSSDGVECWVDDGIFYKKTKNNIKQSTSASDSSVAKEDCTYSQISLSDLDLESVAIMAELDGNSKTEEEKRVWAEHLLDDFLSVLVMDARQVQKGSFYHEAEQIKSALKSPLAQAIALSFLNDFPVQGLDDKENILMLLGDFVQYGLLGPSTNEFLKFVFSNKPASSQGFVGKWLSGDHDLRSLVFGEIKNRPRLLNTLLSNGLFLKLRENPQASLKISSLINKGFFASDFKGKVQTFSAGKLALKIVLRAFLGGGLFLLSCIRYYFLIGFALLGPRDPIVLAFRWVQGFLRDQFLRLAEKTPWLKKIVDGITNLRNSMTNFMDSYSWDAIKNIWKNGRQEPLLIQTCQLGLPELTNVLLAQPEAWPTLRSKAGETLQQLIDHQKRRTNLDVAELPGWQERWEQVEATLKAALAAKQPGNKPLDVSQAIAQDIEMQVAQAVPAS